MRHAYNCRFFHFRDPAVWAGGSGDRRSITVAYRVHRDPSEVLMALAFHGGPDFMRKRACRIAATRLRTNPLHFEGGDLTFTNKDARRLALSFLIFRPEWSDAGDAVDVGRFGPREGHPGAGRWEAHVLHDEAAVRVLVDGVKPVPPKRLKSIDAVPPEPVGWVFKCIPRWAGDFIQEASCSPASQTTTSTSP